ncbi:MAG: trypsin-like serine protease [Acidimicrobiales bacterium]|nr:trypsin-like serine protease [Acidimicrobiales bacterium]
MSRRRVAALGALLALVTLVSLPGAARAAAMADPDGPPAPPVGKVVGGQPAPPGRYPELVALLLPDRGDDFLAQFCGGTLIDPSWVLTAAHCVTPTAEFPIDPTRVRVLAGRQDLRGSGGERIPVAQALPYPGYDPDSFTGDLALLRLATPASQAVMPLMFPGTEPAPWADASPAQIVGWGRVTPSEVNGRFPDDLQEAATLIRSDAVCQGAWGDLYVVGQHLCAQSPAVDTCPGDSGGPILGVTLQGRVAVAGIVSFGPEVCATLPGVYTRVATFDSWIRTTLGPTLPSESTAVPVAHALQRLYLATFLRVPDQGGFDYWLGWLRSGVPLELVAGLFTLSPEFQARYGQLTSGDFVKVVYGNVLDREPDPEGYAYWATRIENGSISRGAMMTAFSESAEYRVITGIS